MTPCCSRRGRAAYARLLQQGWTDSIRTLYPDEAMYTYWDYKRMRWQRNGGLRIDHILLSPDVAGRLEAAGVDREVRGREDASDSRAGMGGCSAMARKRDARLRNARLRNAKTSERKTSERKPAKPIGKKAPLAARPQRAGSAVGGSRSNESAIGVLD